MPFQINAINYARVDALRRDLSAGKRLVSVGNQDGSLAVHAALAWAAHAPSHTDIRYFRRDYEPFVDKLGACGLTPQGFAELFAVEKIAKRHGMNVGTSFVPVPTMDAKEERLCDRNGTPLTALGRGFRARMTTFDRGSERRSDPLLILHGLGENGAVNYAYRAIDFFNVEGSPVVIFDWTGHGETDSLHLPTYAEEPSDYTAVLDAVFAELQKRYAGRSLRIMAHSMGGAALLTYWADHPESPYLDFVRNMTFVAPMLGLRGMGYVSQLLYPLGLLGLVTKDKVVPLGFPIEQLTADLAEQDRIRMRQLAGVSDWQTAEQSRWILAANAMMEAVKNLGPDRFSKWPGVVNLFASPEGDKVTDGRVAIERIFRIFPTASAHHETGPHRLHTDNGVWPKIRDALMG